MSYRVCRKTTSTTFKVQGHLCKVFLEPKYEYKPGFWLWSVGFAVGRSRRQLNDWYWRRKNKRSLSLHKKMVGTAGIQPIAKAFEAVLRLRWNLAPGDALFLDCTSKDPDKQFRAWQRWQRYHKDCIIDVEQQKFFWYRPPYPDDKLYSMFKVIPQTPHDPMMSCHGDNYFLCFQLLPKDFDTSQPKA